MTETEAMHTGKTLIHFQISTPSLHNQNHPSSAHSHSAVIIFISLFFLLGFASKPMESLEQITAFDVEKLLSKSAILSENLLLQLQQSLTKEWGAGSISTLPKNFMQKLLTEVWSIGNGYYSPITHILALCLKIFYLSFLPLISLIDFIFRA